MRTSSSNRSGRLGAVVVAAVGAVLGAAAGVGIGIGGALLSRALNSDGPSWQDLGIAAFGLVLLAPVLAVVGTLLALRLRTGRAIPRPLLLATTLGVVGAAAGALIGDGVFRWTLGGLGVAVGLVVAAGLDAGVDGT